MIIKRKLLHSATAPQSFNKPQAYIDNLFTHEEIKAMANGEVIPKCGWEYSVPGAKKAPVPAKAPEPARDADHYMLHILFLNGCLLTDSQIQVAEYMRDKELPEWDQVWGMVDEDREVFVATNKPGKAGKQFIRQWERWGTCGDWNACRHIPAIDNWKESLTRLK